MTFVSYVDQGELLNQGQTLKGRNTAVLDLDLAAPGATQTSTTRVSVVTTYQGRRSSIGSACCGATDAALNQQRSEAYLAKTAKLPSVEVTASGLQYQALQKGYGESPLETNQVTVNYRGLLPSGVIFDSGTHITFPLRGVIAGWTEGLQYMKVGAKYRFYIPADLAYGERGTGGLIGPNAALVFDVELLEVK
ncbi:MAG: FKBP-type peptidyl-prolyl cis-trans isomerase [Methylococcaceae bacterium]|nr:MAG: FKBP-type peptidyl-prolyl cis-trans isomerase [Methylococcaceae bacterium]